MKKDKKVKILMVCMGNICRSPTAHGVFENLVKAEGLSHLIEVDSAGTHAYHVGEKPDRRSQQTALSHGIDLDYIRGRQVLVEDFEVFDYVLAMDADNYGNLSKICPDAMEDKLHMFLSFDSSNSTKEVPDPYYGGSKGFENVYDLINNASAGLLSEIKREINSKL
jgi:protein-tyrosine phosphatase